MARITFNAFSFLQKKLKEKGIEYTNAQMEIEPDSTPAQLMQTMGLTARDVEVVFLNGRVAPFDTPIQDGDRLAFVPQGTPGPYRVFLGFKNPDNQTQGR